MHTRAPHTQTHTRTHARAHTHTAALAKAGVLTAMLTQVVVGGSGTVTVDELEKFLLPPTPTLGAASASADKLDRVRSMEELKKQTAWELKLSEAAAKLSKAKAKLRAAAYIGGKKDFRRLFGNLDRDHSAVAPPPSTAPLPLVHGLAQRRIVATGVVGHC